MILTGGGNRGAIQVGAVAALLQSGFTPSLIVGVSVGAINGAYLAFHPTPAGAEDLARIWRALEGRRLFGTRHLRMRTILALIQGRPAAFSNKRLRHLLESALPSDRFEDTQIPFVVTATHLESGTGRVISQGNLVDAVLASSAVPGLLPPVTVAGERLIDGAVAEPMPLHVIGEHGLSRLVVIDPGHACRCPRVYETGLSMIQQSVSVMARRVVRAEYGGAESRLEILHIGLSCHDEVPFTDFSLAPQMIESGHAEASSILDSHPGGLPWRREHQDRQVRHASYWSHA